MKQAPTMVSAENQILTALRTLEGVTVTTRWPRQRLARPTVVLTEVTNAQTSQPVVDALSYQIDVWAEDPDQVRALVQQVDVILSGIGFLRTMEPMAFDGRGYRRTMRYSRNVDKRFMRLVD